MKTAIRGKMPRTFIDWVRFKDTLTFLIGTGFEEGLHFEMMGEAFSFWRGREPAFPPDGRQAVRKSSDRQDGRSRKVFAVTRKPLGRTKAGQGFLRGFLSDGLGRPDRTKSGFIRQESFPVNFGLKSFVMGGPKQGRFISTFCLLIFVRSLFRYDTSLGHPCGPIPVPIG